MYNSVTVQYAISLSYFTEQKHPPPNFVDPLISFIIIPVMGVLGGWTITV